MFRGCLPDSLLLNCVKFVHKIAEGEEKGHEKGHFFFVKVYFSAIICQDKKKISYFCVEKFLYNGRRFFFFNRH